MARALENDVAPRAQMHILAKDMHLATEMAPAAGYAAPLRDAALARLRETMRRVDPSSVTPQC